MLTPSQQQQGFTLLEVMLVIFLMGVAVSATLLSIGGSSEDKQLKQQANRFAALVQYAQEQSLLSGYDYGIYSDELGYKFARLESQRWQGYEEPPFQAVTVKEPMYLSLELDGFAAEQGYGNLGLAENSLFSDDFIEEEEKHQIIPQVFILSSGEITPFKMLFHYEDQQSYWQLSSDDLGQLQLSQGGNNDN